MKFSTAPGRAVGTRAGDVEFTARIGRGPVARAVGLVLACTGLPALAAAPPAPLMAPQLGPLVQVIDADERDDHVDISIQFSCSVRYISNTPMSRGTTTTITLRLGPDCGSLLNVFPPEMPLVGGGGQLVTGARVDSYVPGEVTLQLTWARELDFIMAPTASGLGLRVRLLGINKKKAGVFLAEPDATTGYSVNLDSELQPIDRATIEAAAASLKTQAYVSETDVEGQHWYRLRVGPYATRAEADRVLQIALASYPRAWVAVNDEQTELSLIEHAGAQSIAASAPQDPPLPDEERARILREARTALEKHQYPEAVDLFSRLLRQPEYPQRADAQELIGLARERAGQLAQAKAEYEEYLRRYPNGAGAERVRGRLRALIEAALAPKSLGQPGAQGNRWTFAGTTSLTYQYEKDQTSSAGTTNTTTSVNAALIYADLLVRDRGERYDFTSRVDAGYTKNIVSTFGGSQDRTTAAYVELTDRMLGLTGRVGRQTLASQGIIGLFDGLYVGYQLNPKFTVSVAGGLPAYTAYSSPSGQTKFGTVTAEFDPFHLAWVFDAYFFDQMVGPFTDRRSVGFQTRYTQPGRTAVVLVDYDIEFQKLNSATLIGNAKVGQSWILGFDADHRRSPLLELNNALIGQTATSLNALPNSFSPALTPSQIRQMAVDRTATSNTFVISASRPLGQRWQFMADLAGLQLSSTPASFGVPATPSPGLDKSASLQLSGLSLLQASDLHIFSVRYDNSPISRSTTLSWDARFVIHGAWRMGPRLSVEQLNDPEVGGKQYLYLPQVRTDWTGRRAVFEFTAGYELQHQLAQQQQQSVTGVTQTGALDQRSLYLSATYRFRF